MINLHMKSGIEDPPRRVVFWSRIQTEEISHLCDQGPEQRLQGQKVVNTVFAAKLSIVLVFLREKHQGSQKRRNSWTSRFGPFFGLVCRGDSWKRGVYESTPDHYVTTSSRPNFSSESVSSLRAQRLTKFKIALRDWNLQARLNISSEPPTKPLFLWVILKVKIEFFKRDWKCQARLIFSIFGRLGFSGITTVCGATSTYGPLCTNTVPSSAQRTLPY